MALVLFAIVLLLLSGIGVLSIGQTSRIFSIRNAAEISARSAADAGITKVIARMNNIDGKGTIWNGTGWLYEFLKVLPNSNDSRYSYFVAKAKSYDGDILPSGDDPVINFFRAASAEEGDYIIVSMGRYNVAEKTIYAVARLRGRGDSAIIVRDSITLKAGTIVDGRDSRDASVDGTAEVGTISTLADKVILNNGVYIDGNVQVGVGGDPAVVVKDLGADVTGMMYPLPEEPPFPYIYPPILPDYGAAKLYAKGKDLYITDANNGSYSMIDLQTMGLGPTEPPRVGRLIVQSGDVVLHLTNTGIKDSISLGVGCEIVIMPGATLNLYVDGNISSGTDSGFNNMGLPPDLKIWGNWRPDVTGGEVVQNWTINAKSVYFGQIYAPTANIVVNAKGDLYGAFTANSFDMRNGGNLYYDAALRDVDPDDEGVRFAIRRWYE